MFYIIVLAFIVTVFFPFGRFFITHFFQILFGALKDAFVYIRYKRWRECKSYGRICCYSGLFGQGKTKECVKFIVEQYERYNGLMIYDFDAQKWVQQRIVIYSNVNLNIPYIKLTSLQQLVDCQGSEFGIVNLFLIDEASVEFNSREFKKNFSTPALNSILTARHNRIGLYLTAQRFGHMDALLRQVTTYVYECAYFKPLRIQRIKVYDAWECENCTNLMLLQPLQVIYTYTTDDVYGNYDTNALVEEISKECVANGFYDDNDYINRQASRSSDIQMLNKHSRKLKKRM